MRDAGRRCVLGKRTGLREEQGTHARGKGEKGREMEREERGKEGEMGKGDRERGRGQEVRRDTVKKREHEEIETLPMQDVGVEKEQKDRLMYHTARGRGML